MRTQPGIQTAFPWFEGPQELQPANNEPEPFGDYFGDDLPHPEALGLKFLAVTKRSH